MKSSLSLVCAIISTLFLTAGCHVLVEPTDPNAPVAYSFSADTYEDQSFTDHLDGQPTKGGYLVYEIVDSPLRGTISGFDSETGYFTYRPFSNFSGSDYFTYRVWEDGLYSDVAVVSIEVHATNARPTAASFSIFTREDQSRSGVLVGYDRDGDRLRFTVTSYPLKGNLTVDSQTGAYLYRPYTDENGSDSFTYTVNDGQQTSQEAMVSIDLDSVNDAPVAQPVSFNVTAGSCYSGGLTSSDVDSGQRSYSIVNRPLKGSLTLNTITGAFTYCADQGTSSSDSFTFKAYDGMDYSSPAQASVYISPSDTVRNVSTKAPSRAH